MKEQSGGVHTGTQVPGGHFCSFVVVGRLVGRAGGNMHAEILRQLVQLDYTRGRGRVLGQRSGPVCCVLLLKLGLPLVNGVRVGSARGLPSLGEALPYWYGARKVGVMGRTET